jgi:arylsulfatase A-like enzyme
LLDIFPTVISLAGISTPPNLDGSDLSAIWKGDSERVRDSVFLGFTNWSRSVRDERYKLIKYPQIDHTQLFDLQADPYEMNNLADDSQHAEQIERMTSLLKQWQQKLGDDQPLVVDDPKPKEIDLTGREREPDNWQPEWIVKKYF